MLSKNDYDLLNKRGYCFNHNPKIIDFAMGEPYQDEGLLYFVIKNKSIVINAFPMLFDNSLDSKINNIVRKWKDDVEFVRVYGEKDFNLTNLLSNEFDEVFEDIFDDTFDLSINFDLLEGLPKYKNNSKRDIRKALNAGLDVTLQRYDSFPKEYFPLLDEFVERRKGDLDNLNLMTFIALMKNIDKDLLCFEARQDSVIKGVKIVDTKLKNLPIYRFGFYPREIKGVSALLYDSAIRWAKDDGARIFSLGYGDEGITDYKMKFGCNFRTPSKGDSLRRNAWRRKDSNFIHPLETYSFDKFNQEYAKIKKLNK